MNRRSFLVSTAAASTSVAFAGCSSVFSSDPDALSDVDPDPDQLPSPAQGSGDVTFDVYVDFECPSCRSFERNIMPIIEEELIETGDVTHRGFDFPIPVGDRSVPIANAARAVQDNTRTDDDSAGEYFAFVHAFFAVEDWDDQDWSDDQLVDLADGVGADLDAVSDALEEHTYYPTIAADREYASDNGVSGTPGIIIDGTLIDTEDLTVNDLIELARDAQ